MPRKAYVFGMKDSEWYKLPYLVRKRILRDQKLKLLEDEKKARLAMALQVMPAASVPAGSIYAALNYTPPITVADRIKEIEKEVNIRLKRERY